MLAHLPPAGLEEFFREVGIPIATRTTPPPKLAIAKLSDEQEAAFTKKVVGLAPKYRIELLKRPSLASGEKQSPNKTERTAAQNRLEAKSDDGLTGMRDR